MRAINLENERISTVQEPANHSESLMTGNLTLEMTLAFQFIHFGAQ
jgi:hypothetical protein